MGRSAFRLALVVMLFAGMSCSNGGEASGVEAILTLHAITVTSSDVPAGAIRFVARNVDDGRHELVVLRTDRRADDLPMRASRAATDAPGIDTVAHVEAFDGPAERSTTVDLEPGPYVLICNLAGHYMLGMHTGLQVK